MPLKWGTTTISGYVVEGLGETDTTGESTIEDEIGDVVTQIVDFGKMTDVSIDVIPDEDAVEPDAGDIFSYGSKAIVISSIDKKQAKKDVEKWSIKGKRYPGVDLS